MNNARKKMLEKVKAILSKTMENGCTEEEAMSALAKARELMATYEIDETEIAAFDREEVKIHRSIIDDPYEIKKNLRTSVGQFTRCRAYDSSAKGHYGASFIGLESDVIFAKWLLETLQHFVMRALRDFQKQNAKEGAGNNNLKSASFVVGCVARIAEKLKLLTPVEWNVNKAVIEAKMAEKGITLYKSAKDNRPIDGNSAAAGYKAGNSATFNRPVSAGGGKYLK